MQRIKAQFDLSTPCSPAILGPSTNRNRSEEARTRGFATLPFGSYAFLRRRLLRKPCGYTRINHY